MRKTIVVTATALGLGAMMLLNAPIIARAQTATPAPAAATKADRQAGGKRMQKLATDLGLTDAQKAQMKPIMKAAADQTKAVRQDATLSPADKKAKMKAIRESMRSQMLPILTPDQKAKMATMRQKGAKKGLKA